MAYKQKGNPFRKVITGAANQGNVISSDEYRRANVDLVEQDGAQFFNVRRKGGYGEKRYGNRAGELITSEFGGQPVEYDEMGNISAITSEGEFYRPDATNLGTSSLATGSSGTKVLGSKVRQKFDRSTLNRVEGGEMSAGGKGRGGWILGKKGRATQKGLVNKYVEGSDSEGKRYKETYTSGENLAKATRRKQGSLDIQKDKTKRKRKGLVRKTGEGFLGLQNRKKYIDGVLQEKGADKQETIAQERRRKRREYNKSQRQQRRDQRQSSNPYRGMTSTQAEKAKYRDTYGY